MSRITEMAEAEADAVEAAEDEETTVPEPESVPDPEPEPEPPVGEAAVKAIEREDERHRKAVAKIMGTDFALVHVCDGCLDFTGGFTFTPPTTEPEFKASTDSMTCPACNGLGEVLSGSNSPTHRLKACAPCTGFGYVPKTQQQPLPQQQGGQTLPSPNGVGLIQPFTDAFGQPSAVGPDAYGQAWGSPGYGSPPAN